MDAGMTYLDGRRVLTMVRGMIDLRTSVSLMGRKGNHEQRSAVLQSIAGCKQRICLHELVASHLQVFPHATDVCISKHAAIDVQSPETKTSKGQDRQVQFSNELPLLWAIVRMKPLEKAALSRG